MSKEGRHTFCSIEGTLRTFLFTSRFLHGKTSHLTSQHHCNSMIVEQKIELKHWETINQVCSGNGLCTSQGPIDYMEVILKEPNIYKLSFRDSLSKGTSAEDIFCKGTKKRLSICSSQTTYMSLIVWSNAFFTDISKVVLFNQYCRENPVTDCLNRGRGSISPKNENDKNKTLNASFFLQIKWWLIEDARIMQSWNSIKESRNKT